VGGQCPPTTPGCAAHDWRNDCRPLVQLSATVGCVLGAVIDIISGATDDRASNAANCRRAYNDVVQRTATMQLSILHLEAGVGCEMRAVWSHLCRRRARVGAGCDSVRARCIHQAPSCPRTSSAGHVTPDCTGHTRTTIIVVFIYHTRTAGLAESNGNLPLGLWLTSPRLTVKNRDQLWNHRVWAIFFIPELNTKYRN